MNDKSTDMSTDSGLKLFNSLSRELEPYSPIHAGEARVYTCGPTVYNFQHIGNMRAYIFADTLGRALAFKGHHLTHIINITDVGHLTSDADDGDDKMESAAQKSGKSIWEIAKFYTEAYWNDIKRLNIRQPAKWSIATEHVEEMIEYAKGIADKHCYELDGGLYFDSSTVPNYGSLARAETEDGESRINPVDGKRHQSDFAIWRKSPEGENRQMEWDSPWGKGAPGWHLECSVMSMKYLGDAFDIHTGGIDHREIHHPNEIAQNQAHTCSEHSGANIWMHNNFLIDRGGKMSKSTGDFKTLQWLVDRGVHPLAYRLMCLSAHYRSELEFSGDNMVAALTRLKRTVMLIENLKGRAEDLGWVADIAEYQPNLESRGFASLIEKFSRGLPDKLADKLKGFDEAIADDLMLPRALPLLDEVVGMKKVAVDLKLKTIAIMDLALGLNLLDLERKDLRIKPKDAQMSEAEIEDALALRKQARAEKDFAKSDAIRDELAASGVDAMDGDPLGWEWKIEI